VAKQVKVGIIGTGNISSAYVKWIRTFEILDLVACADIDMAKAQELATKFEIPKVLSVESMLSDPEIEIIVNLTIPAVHAEVSLSILQSGKHVYSEKPLAINRQDGQQILKTAKDRGLLVGCAPDTFLGGGQQTCRKLIDDGQIGEPVAAVAFMLSHGPESWHPNPDFYYKLGGGPMFDMGPYYLTSLINLLGPVRRVTGATRVSFAERIATSVVASGRRIPVDTPTHIAGLLDFASGPIATLITSFDVWGHNLPRIEIYGSEGTLSVPDPNIFGGPVRLYKPQDKVWVDVPLTHTEDTGRGIGVADMAYAILYGRPHRASGELAYHVLDLMATFDDASTTGQHIDVASTTNRPAPLPVGLPAGQLDSEFASA
jgi:predicted dehydrogenase